MRSIKSYSQSLKESMILENLDASKRLSNIASNHAGYDRETVINLLKIGANPEYVDELGHSTFCYAAAKGNPEFVAILLDAGADINAPAYSGFCPIHYACIKSSNSKIIKLLASKGANLEKKSNDGSTALRLSVIRGHATNAKAMLNLGVNPFTAFKDIDDIKRFFKNDLSWWKNINPTAKRMLRSEDLFGEI